MALKALKGLIDPDGNCWDPVQHQVQCVIILFASSPTHAVPMSHSCMEHSLHLAVGHVLSHITPMHTEKKHHARKYSEDDKSSPNISASNDGSAIILHALHKLLGLIKQVCVIHRIYYLHLYIFQI